VLRPVLVVNRQLALLDAQHAAARLKNEAHGDAIVQRLIVARGDAGRLAPKAEKPLAVRGLEAKGSADRQSDGIAAIVDPARRRAGENIAQRQWRRRRRRRRKERPLAPIAPLRLRIAAVGAMTHADDIRGVVVECRAIVRECAVAQVSVHLQRAGDAGSDPHRSGIVDDLPVSAAMFVAIRVRERSGGHVYVGGAERAAVDGRLDDDRRCRTRRGERNRREEAD